MRAKYVSRAVCDALRLVQTGHGREPYMGPYVTRTLRKMRLLAPTKVRLNQRGKSMLRRCR